MPAAATATCAVCSLETAKYTCPACSARTCSLACTKAHKAHSCGTGSSATASTSANSAGPSSNPAAAGSTSNDSGNGAGSSSVDAGKGKVLSYVPLKEYGEGQMMQDYLFLSSVSRAAAENGRKILSLNLMPPTDPSQKHGQSSTANGNNARMTNQQRQREQLIKQLHYRKYRVMILPDGMARRKMNQSAFNPKDKRFGLTVEIKAPAHLGGSKGKGKGNAEEAEEKQAAWVLNKQDPERFLAEVVLGDLERRSFTNRKELLKLKQTLPKPTSAPSKHETWIISAAILNRAQLLIPTNAARLPPKDAAADELIVLRNFPKEDWAIVVPTYSARLTNESTTRYLDWWVRKRKWEEANPELAKQQREDEEEGRNTRPRLAGREGEGWNRWPDRNAAVQDKKTEQEELSPPPAPPLESMAAVSANGGNGGIISNSLLNILSQRLGRSQPELAPATSPPPVPEPAPPAPAKAESAAQSILVHATNPTSTSLDYLLRNLPEGYSVVELPELRILPRVQLEQIQKAGREMVVQLAPETAEEEEKAEVDQQEKKDAREQPKSTVTVVTSGSLGGLLAGYDSDSDSNEGEDAGPEEDKPSKADERAEEPTENSASLAQLAMLHGFIPASAQD